MINNQLWHCIGGITMQNILQSLPQDTLLHLSMLLSLTNIGRTSLYKCHCVNVLKHVAQTTTKCRNKNA